MSAATAGTAMPDADGPRERLPRAPAGTAVLEAGSPRVQLPRAPAGTAVPEADKPRERIRRALIGIARLWPQALSAAAAAIAYWALTAHLDISLWPHARALEALAGIRFQFVPDLGYVASDGLIALTSGCVGAKLFVSAFLLLALGFPPRGRAARRLLVLASYFGGAALGALWVTVARIAASVPLCHLPNAQFLHNALSLFVYFGSLTTLYVIAQALAHRRGGGEP